MRIACLNTLLGLASERLQFNTIIGVTVSNQPHGTVPSMVRKSVATITGSLADTVYTLPFMEALFSLLGFLVSAPVGVSAFNQSGNFSPIIYISHQSNLLFFTYFYF